MPKVSLQEPAPDFSLEDYQGKEIRLSQFKGEKHILLVLNRGFS
jgi:peroxiredoxin